MRPTRPTFRTTPASRSSTTTPAAAATSWRTGSTRWARRSEANTLYKEGAGYPALTPFSIDYSFYRDGCGKGGSITPIGAVHRRDAASRHRQQRHRFHLRGYQRHVGRRRPAPGGAGAARTSRRRSTATASSRPRCSMRMSARRRRRTGCATSPAIPANNSTFGTLSIRRRFVNNTGGNVTRLRFRVIDLDDVPRAVRLRRPAAAHVVAVVVAGITDAATCAATGAPGRHPARPPSRARRSSSRPRSPTAAASTAA